MSDDYAFVEYRAKITHTGHAEDDGEPVHCFNCFIKMKSSDANGKRRHNVDHEQQAGDNILFILNPGPYRKISHSSIWVVGEEIFEEAGPPLQRETVRSFHADSLVTRPAADRLISARPH